MFRARTVEPKTHPSAGGIGTGEPALVSTEASLLKRPIAGQIRRAITHKVRVTQALEAYDGYNNATYTDENVRRLSSILTVTFFAHTEDIEKKRAIANESSIDDFRSIVSSERRESWWLRLRLRSPLARRFACKRGGSSNLLGRVGVSLSQDALFAP